MPSYSTKCASCRAEKDVRLTFSQYDEVQAGTRKIACSCGADTEIQFAPGHIGFSFKDGESGGWASKAMKENAYRANRSQVMARRERDHVFKNKLVPNYKGEETGTWREAQHVAQKEGGELSAVTYEPLVQKEQTS